MDAHKVDQKDAIGIIEAVAAISASTQRCASEVTAGMAQTEELQRGCQTRPPKHSCNTSMLRT